MIPWYLYFSFGLLVFSMLFLLISLIRLGLVLRKYDKGLSNLKKEYKDLTDSLQELKVAIKRIKY